MKIIKKIRRMKAALVWRLFVWSSHRWAAYEKYPTNIVNRC